ncbi:hypothetical protein STCU_11550 [Strigomonas culicis]|uniref:Uncharacterized protein n=1 Tax=Strigomonas culicis TaxID=28005 RepID=S9TIE9_9TRYP|nr:hypothetical protein STCU_11550 [Strigomonas culicis]|eukprot:EPY16103.1 hypothetical protein STCU_11550 [Strigomonas culicis]
MESEKIQEALRRGSAISVQEPLSGDATAAEDAGAMWESTPPRRAQEEAAAPRSPLAAAGPAASTPNRGFRWRVSPRSSSISRDLPAAGAAAATPPPPLQPPSLLQAAAPDAAASTPLQHDATAHFEPPGDPQPALDAAAASALLRFYVARRLVPLAAEHLLLLHSSYAAHLTQCCEALVWRPCRGPFHRYRVERAEYEAREGLLREEAAGYSGLFLLRAHHAFGVRQCTRLTQWAEATAAQLRQYVVEMHAYEVALQAETADAPQAAASGTDGTKKKKKVIVRTKKQTTAAPESAADASAFQEEEGGSTNTGSKTDAASAAAAPPHEADAAAEGGGAAEKKVKKRKTVITVVKRKKSSTPSHEDTPSDRAEQDVMADHDAADGHVHHPTPTLNSSCDSSTYRQGVAAKAAVRPLSAQVVGSSRMRDMSPERCGDGGLHYYAAPAAAPAAPPSSHLGPSQNNYVAAVVPSPPMLARVGAPPSPSPLSATAAAQQQQQQPYNVGPPPPRRAHPPTSQHSYNTGGEMPARKSSYAPPNMYDGAQYYNQPYDV